MSLRVFHFIFITLSMLLCFGFAWWAYGSYQMQNNTTDMILVAVGSLGGLVLIAYEVWFYRKTRKMIL